MFLWANSAAKKKSLSNVVSEQVKKQLFAEGFLFQECFCFSKNSKHYCLMHRSVTFHFHFTVGMKPSDITIWPCLTTHAYTWLISNHQPKANHVKVGFNRIIIPKQGTTRYNINKQYQQTTGFIQRLINFTLLLLIIVTAFIEISFETVCLFVCCFFFSS